MNDPLKIVTTDHNTNSSSSFQNHTKKRKSRREEARAKFERLWLTSPNKFNPLLSAMGRERIKRTSFLLNEYIKLPGSLVVDLGCGQGDFSYRLTEAGANVHSIDISQNALKILKEKYPEISEVSQDYVPETKLQDDKFDLVLAMELIAYLQPEDYRLFFSELSRIMKPTGYVVCSTKIDLDSDDSLERFKNLAETEFKFVSWIFSYHRYYIHLCDFIKAPLRFSRGSNDAEYRKEQIIKRYGFNRLWFEINSAYPLAYFWKIFQFVSRPIFGILNQSHTLMNFLERICKFFCGQTGISHAMFIAVRRPLENPPFEHPVREMKHKRQVWE